MAPRTGHLQDFAHQPLLFGEADVGLLRQRRSYPALELEAEGDADLGQYFTPAWFASALYQEFFSDLSYGDVVWEPSAGIGAFLGAVPEHVEAFGTEIDAEKAGVAERVTGRRVIVGDFRSVVLPPEKKVTAVIGNPPFKVDLIDSLLSRCAKMLDEGRRCGLIQPAYAIQTSANVVRWNRDWTIRQEAIPRDVFPGLSKPLTFVLYTRDRKPQLIGFRLYHEVREYRELNERAQRLLAEPGPSSKSVWRRAVEVVLKDRGGRASLPEIYAAFLGRRPTETEHWKAQIRKVLQQEPFERVDAAVYALPAAA